MATAAERKKINAFLRGAQLATLDDPRALLNALAMGITDHARFREMLLKVEPTERNNAYHAIAPRLKFTAKPLEDYIIEGKQNAETQKLPVYDHETGRVRDFGDPGPINLNALAAKAIEQAEKEREAKGGLELVCRRCTFAESFPAKNKRQAYKDAAAKGWKYDGAEKAQCPNCAKGRVQ